MSINQPLQNRFRFDFRFGFGILTSDDGMAGYLVWERKMVLCKGDRDLLIDNLIRAS